ncbi:MAG TPA: helix-turn-helix domain-containing protein [Rariglobus sp.]|jgi:AraC-like DNA-binding protein/ligand-binding sensor protein|nr:helix-turn-helix domain-containing protein [Rariglobus sp.]
MSARADITDRPAQADQAIRAAMVLCLQQSKLFRDYKQAFETTTGLPLVLRAAGSFQAPLQGSKLTNPFCALMIGSNTTCASCLQLQQRVETDALMEAKTLKCYAGLSESAVPVRVGRDVLGYLQTGQVFLGAPSRRRFNAMVRVIPGAESAVGRRHMEASYFQTRVLGKTQYQAIIRLLVIFAEHLAAVSNQLLTSRITTESPLITKARAFIALHQDEALGLEDAAQAVNMSPFYFCKVFKKSTGLTFTHYLARARIESVKHLLLDAHMRVSEAAYASGFQSLSQFNRVFLRVAGEAPRRYRERLRGEEGKLKSS